MHVFKKHKTTILISAILVIAAIAAAAVTPSALRHAEISHQFEIAMRYANDLDYSSALLAFSKILEIDPNNKEARQALQDTYLAYIRAEWDNGSMDHAKELMAEMKDILGLKKDPYIASVKKEATCGYEGLEEWKCTLDDSVLLFFIPATEKHIWDSGTVTVGATYQNDGVITYLCTVCQSKTTQNLKIDRYKLFDESMTWEEAKLYCESSGGHLVTITSEEEQRTVEALLENEKKKQYWIGIKRVDNELRWITNEPCSYTNWDNFEPNANTKRGYIEEYGQIFNAANPAIPDSQRFKWNDMYIDNTFPDEESFFCIDNVGFICEYE